MKYPAHSDLFSLVPEGKLSLFFAEKVAVPISEIPSYLSARTAQPNLNHTPLQFSPIAHTTSPLVTYYALLGQLASRRVRRI